MMIQIYKPFNHTAKISLHILALIFIGFYFCIALLQSEIDFISKFTLFLFVLVFTTNIFSLTKQNMTSIEIDFINKTITKCSFSCFLNKRKETINIDEYNSIACYTTIASKSKTIVNLDLINNKTKHRITLKRASSNEGDTKIIEEFKNITSTIAHELELKDLGFNLKDYSYYLSR